MVNIFIVIFCFSLSLAFFVLFHANFMANAGNTWDNAKKSSSTR
jgi:Na+/H+-translocating membrane pyrophosphatase